MNPWMINAMADAHTSEMRREAARYRTAGRPVPRPVHGMRHWRQLRQHVGFGLVEAGLRVLATSRPTS